MLYFSLVISQKYVTMLEILHGTYKKIDSYIMPKKSLLSCSEI